MPDAPENAPAPFRPPLWLALALAGLIAVYLLLRPGGAALPALLGGAPYAAEAANIMHSDAHVIVVPDAAMTVTPEDAANLAFDAMREVERLASAFVPASDVSRVNDAAGKGPVAVDPLTWTLIQESLRFHRLTDGTFDITVGPLVRIYRYENKPVTEFPPDAAIWAALNLVGSDKIVCEREGMRVGLAKAGMRIDLGGIAPGFAVDRALEALRRVGVKSALVEQGGEVRAMGTVPLNFRAKALRQDIGSAGTSADAATGATTGSVRPWRTEIKHPRDPLAKTIEIDRTDCAISTSGDYEKYFEFGGKRYSHLLDPRTGRPLSGGVVSATVISPRSCLEADALAKGMSILDEAGRKRLLKTFPGIEAYLYILQDDGSLREVHLAPEPETASPDGVPAAADAPAEK